MPVGREHHHRQREHPYSVLRDGRYYSAATSLEHAHYFAKRAVKHRKAQVDIYRRGELVESIPAGRRALSDRSGDTGGGE